MLYYNIYSAIIILTLFNYFFILKDNYALNED